MFAYDGSDLAEHAIAEAGRLFAASNHDALVLTVWQPFDVGFVPAGELEFDAAQVREVKQAARATAAAGASLATTAGFQAESAEVEAAPIWKGIADFADHHDARLIVLGSHGRSGLGRLFGSVAAAVAAHSRRSVLIVHHPAEPEADGGTDVPPG